MRTRSIAVAVAACAAVALPALAVTAAPGDEQLTGAAAASERALRIVPEAPDVDVVRISNFSTLRSDLAAAAREAVAEVGGASGITRSAGLPMRRVRRGNSVVQVAPSGMSYSMGTTAMSPAAVAALMGPRVAASLSPSSIVMGELTAQLRGARTGDVIEVVASNGTLRSLTIGAVVSDAVTGGTELLMSVEAAERLGIVKDSSILLWGFSSREALDAALAERGIVDDLDLRVRRSWDPPSPDSTLGLARTKAALGEFAYRVTSTGAVVIESAWVDANISRDGPIGGLTLRTGCHVIVREALRNAMDELIAAGLEDTINYRDANSAGGCFVPRFNRSTPDSSLGFLSRHSWGMAVDTNTIGSCQGCAPPDMDCRTVRIFRRHGFAWGGNFTRPDGMHFEWVGEPRDRIPYRSRYCPNVVDGGARSALVDGSNTLRATLFAFDGALDDH